MQFKKNPSNNCVIGLNDDDKVHGLAKTVMLHTSRTHFIRSDITKLPLKIPSNIGKGFNESCDILTPPFQILVREDQKYYRFICDMFAKYRPRPVFSPGQRLKIYMAVTY